MHVYWNEVSNLDLHWVNVHILEVSNLNLRGMYLAHVRLLEVSNLGLFEN